MVIPVIYYLILNAYPDFWHYWLGWSYLGLFIFMFLVARWNRRNVNEMHLSVMSLSATCTDYSRLLNRYHKSGIAVVTREVKDNRVIEQDLFKMTLGQFALATKMSGPGVYSAFAYGTRDQTTGIPLANGQLLDILGVNWEDEDHAH